MCGTSKHVDRKFENVLKLTIFVTEGPRTFMRATDSSFINLTISETQLKKHLTFLPVALDNEFCGNSFCLEALSGPCHATSELSRQSAAKTLRKKVGLADLGDNRKRGRTEKITCKIKICDHLCNMELCNMHCNA